MKHLSRWVGVLSLLPLAAGAQDVEAVKSFATDFDGYKTGNVYGQAAWRTSSWELNAQCHEVVDTVACGDRGKSLGIRAENGYHSLLHLAPRDCGTVTCSFDFRPAAGLVTMIGFKSAGADWDQFQTPLQINPAAGTITTFHNGQPVPLWKRKLDHRQWYHIAMELRSAAMENQAGSFRITVSAAGEKVDSGWLPLAAAPAAPTALFEIRSVAWCQGQGAFNGYVDNFTLQPDPQDPQLRIRGDRFGSLYRPGEPVTLVGLVTAGTRAVDQAARLDVTDAYGKTVFTAEARVAVPAGQTGRLTYPVPAERLNKYGLYQAKWLLTGASVMGTTATFGITAPSPDLGDNYDSPFGVFQYPHEGDVDPEFRPFLDKQAQLMHDLGIRWVRCNMHWPGVEPVKGKFDWGNMGDFVDELYRRKMHAFVELANTAGWASSSTNRAGGSVDTGSLLETVAPRDFADWETFCRKTAERFRGRVKVFEVWNEPGAPKNGNSNGFWRDSSDNFIQIIKVARRGVKAVDPEAKIMISGFRTVDLGGYFENFVERVFRGALDDADIISFHHWSEDAWGTKVYDLKLLQAKYHKNLPYWNSEAGGSGKTANNVKSVLWSWSAGCQKMFPFIFNLPRYPGNSLVNPDYSPTEGTIAFATMTRFLAGFKPEGQLYTISGAKLFAFTDGKSRIVVAWSETGDPLPATLAGAGAVMDYQGNPAAAAGPDGKVMIDCRPTYVFCKLVPLPLNLMPKLAGGEKFLAGFRLEGPLAAGIGVRAFSFTDGRRRIVAAWSEVPGKELPATVCGAESAHDESGGQPQKAKHGDYNLNTVTVGNRPVYIACSLDGLDLK